jgi:hypothetical protein
MEEQGPGSDGNRAGARFEKIWNKVTVSVSIDKRLLSRRLPTKVLVSSLSDKTSTLRQSQCLLLAGGLAQVSYQRLLHNGSKSVWLRVGVLVDHTQSPQVPSPQAGVNCNGCSSSMRVFQSRLTPRQGDLGRLELVAHTNLNLDDPLVHNCCPHVHDSEPADQLIYLQSRRREIQPSVLSEYPRKM